MNFKLVKAKKLSHKSNGNIVTEIINGKTFKSLYLKEGIHTTLHPIGDITNLKIKK